MTRKEKLAAVAKAVAAKPQAPARPKPAYTATKSPALFGQGRPPAVAVDMLTDDGAFSVQKVLAYLGGQIESTKVKGILDMSDRLKAIYGPYYPFQGGLRSILLPSSAQFLPTHHDTGHEIPGAAAIRKEIGQRIGLATKGVDPGALFAANQAAGGVHTKALNTLVDTAGGFTVPPPTLGDLIDLQRNQEVFSQAGASNVDLPPNGRINFPKLTGGATAYWVGETQTVTDSQETTGTLNLEARKLAIRVPLTNELMRFSSTSIETLIRTDMAAQGALLADLAMLQGTGGTQIKGLITYPTTTTWSQGVDKLISYSVTGGIFQPEDIENMNAALPDKVVPTAWVMRPDMWAKIFNRRNDAVTPGDGKGGFVFNLLRGMEQAGPGQFNGKAVSRSRQVSATRGNGSQTYILTGYFPDWMIGRMGMFEYFVDPYTQLAQYQTVIQCVQFIDAGPRHAASFCIADNVTIA